MELRHSREGTKEQLVRYPAVARAFAGLLICFAAAVAVRFGSVATSGAPRRGVADERFPTVPLSTCLPILHAGRWESSGAHRCTERSAVCSANHTGWDWLALVCGQQRLQDAGAQALLRGRTVIISGDSHIRRLHNQFADALGLEPIDEEGPGKWADKWQQDNATRTSLHFLWNERVKSQDRIFELWHNGTLPPPDIFIADGMAWHARFDQNLASYTLQLKRFRQRAARALKRFRQAGKAPLLMWVESPVPSKKTNAYWGVAESEMRHFNGAAKQVGLVGHPAAPFHLLDLAAIVDDCGCWCRDADGHHAGQEATALMFQIALNMYKYHAALGVAGEGPGSRRRRSWPPETTCEEE